MDDLVSESILDLTRQSDEFFKGVLKGFSCTLRLSSDWGSRHQQYQSKLRKSLAEDPLLKGKFEPKVFLRLGEPPQVQPHYVSISHCKTIGAYGISKNPLGLDIEESTRVTAQLRDRIKATTTSAKHGKPSYDWTAQEAIFKSLWGIQQPKTISQIEIRWAAGGQKTNESFSYVSPRDPTQSLGQGQIIESGPYTLALFFYM